jgi:hypothetical protein
MTSANLKSWSSEISRLALMVTLPQLIASPVSVILIQLLTPSNVVLDLIEIIDFFVISFPLTLAVAIITDMIRRDETSPAAIIVIIIGAALLSNLLHRFVSGSFPEIPVGAAHRQNFSEDDLPGSRGIGPLLNTALRVIGIYWRQFGPLLFVQSCAIGIYVGLKYFKRR